MKSTSPEGEQFGLIKPIVSSPKQFVLKVTNCLLWVICCQQFAIFRVLVEFYHDKNLFCCSFYNEIFHIIRLQMLCFPLSAYIGWIMGGCRGGLEVNI